MGPPGATSQSNGRPGFALAVYSRRADDDGISDAPTPERTDRRVVRRARCRCARARHDALAAAHLRDDGHAQRLHAAAGALTSHEGHEDGSATKDTKFTKALAK